MFNYGPQKTFGSTQKMEVTKSFWQNDRGIIYKTNGTGRDSYIYQNNGGFSIEKKSNQKDVPGTFFTSSPDRYRKHSVEVQSRTVNYRQDGSGRDMYVMFNNGGYSYKRKHLEYRDAFRKSLRQYEPDPNYIKRRRANRAMHMSVQFNKSELTSFFNQDSEQVKTETQQVDNLTSQTDTNFQIMNPENGQAKLKTDLFKSYYRIYNPQQQDQQFQGSRNQFQDTFISDQNKIKTFQQLNTYQKILDRRLSQPKIKEEYVKQQNNSLLKQYKLKPISDIEKSELIKKIIRKSKNQFKNISNDRDTNEKLLRRSQIFTQGEPLIL